LIFVERQTMDMDLRQLQHIFLVICFMCGFITGYRECYGPPERYNEYAYPNKPINFLHDNPPPTSKVKVEAQAKKEYSDLA